MEYSSKFNLRASVFKKCDGFCAYCGKQISFKSFTIDHILSKSYKKENKQSNYFPSCKSCNAEKSFMSVEEYRNKLELIHDKEVKFYFEEPKFDVSLAEEKENAKQVINSDFYINNINHLRVIYKAKEHKNNVKGTKKELENKIEKLQKIIDRLQEKIKDKFFEDKALFKLKQRQDIDMNFINDLKHLIKSQGTEELQLLFHTLNKSYGEHVENLKEKIHQNE